MVEVGKTYYFVIHAYYHVLGTVVAVTGPKQAVLGPVVLRIQSCQRGWSEFFRDGLKNDTNYTIWPDGTEVSGWMIAAPWTHPLPYLPKETKEE